MEKEEKLFRERFQVCSLLRVKINRQLESSTLKGSVSLLCLSYAKIKI